MATDPDLEELDPVEANDLEDDDLGPGFSSDAPDAFDDDAFDDEEDDEEAAEGDDDLADDDLAEDDLDDEDDEDDPVLPLPAFDEEPLGTVTDDEDADDAVEGLREGEFVCRSCFMAKRESALADPERMLCRDCV